MTRKLVVLLLLSGLVACESKKKPEPTPYFLSPGKLNILGTVDERYQSFNIEMLQVTGGKSVSEYYSPIDLKNKRLQRMARALAPSYVRVSGSGANSTYFQKPGEKLFSPPKGFSSIL